jgi:uncharacterized protein YegP (UPF0339 family)
MILLSDRWQFYKDKLGQWQWRKFVTNKVVAVSSDGFNSRQACIINAKTRGYADNECTVLESSS